MTVLTPAEGSRLRGGRYELRRRIGSGGAASVWLAYDSVLDREVAVKLLSEAFAADSAWLARFRREARLAASLGHPNLVAVYDFDAEADRPYIVMAYLPGGSLHERLDSGATVDTRRLADDLLAALECIHAAGIVHRDIKPGNVLFDAAGRACLTDFGVARPEDATSLTKTGQIPGTARYMAPELWRGEPATERSDLYACGVVLTRAIDASPDGEWLRGFAARLGAEDPADRPASAAAARAELDAAGGPAPRVDPPPEPSEATTAVFGGRRDLKRWAPALALTLVVGLVAVALVAAFGGGGDNPAVRQASGGSDSASSKDQPAKDKSSTEPGSGAASTKTPNVAAPVTADPVALNDQGKALIDQGRYDEAIPILQRAVDSYPDGSTELQYGYALFNLANALRLAGRPEEAIPLLEERLRIPDQTDVVQAELDAARADAGEKPAKEPKPPKG